MLNPPLNLLRRTFMLCLALAAVASGSAYAQTNFTCSNPTITPNNSFTITCNPAAPPVASTGGTFSLSAPGTITTGQTGSASVSRTGGNTGAYTATLSITSGTCTISGAATVSFGDGSQTASNTVAIVAPGSAGSCQVSMSLSGPTVTTPNTPATPTGTPATITVSAPAAPAPPAPSGCATFSGQDVALRSTTQSGTPTPVNLASGAVGSFTLPVLPGGHTAGAVQITESSQSPNGAVTIELTLSRCKGEINPNAGACYYRSQITNFNNLTWAAAPLATVPAQYYDIYGICAAYQSSGTWYANVKWTYAACNAGSNNCGFTITWYDQGAQ